MLRNGVIVALHAALLVAGTGGHAADWQVVKTYSDLTLGVDMSSIIRSASIAQIWTNTVYTPAQAWDGVDRPVKSVRVRDVFNCTQKTHSGTQVVYDEGGGVISSRRGSPDLFDDVVPDSNGRALMGIACASK